MPRETKPSITTISFPSPELRTTAPSDRFDPGSAPQAPALVPIDQLRDSAHLPTGRLPDLAAVRQCLQQAGGAAALCSAEGTAALEQLAPRDRSFALLVASVAIHGVEEPLLVRSTPAGLELVAGHLRRYAAELAGLRDVPAYVVEEMTDDEAAGRMARSNHNRVALSAWQWARLVGAISAALGAQSTEVIALKQPRRAGRPKRLDSAASVARAVGVSLSTAKEYLMIGAALSDDVLAKGTSCLSDVHAALGALTFRKLRDLAKIEDEAERIRQIRVTTRLEKKPKERRSSFDVREKGTGAYVLRVSPVARLGLADAQRLLDFLQRERERVKERIELLQSILAEDPQKEALSGPA